MKPNDRLEYLKEEHSRLNKLIDDMEEHTVPDQDEIHDLKKKKLKLKDDIARLEAELQIQWQTVPADDPEI